VTQVLVTGGSGYFGSLLVTRLLADGHRVRNLDLITPETAGDADTVIGDIRDPDAVRRAVEGVDVVYHNVAQVPLARDRRLLRTVNVDGTRTLLDACVAAGVGKVVHTSSSAVFGVPEHNPVMRESVPAPMEDYGHAKLAAEWSCLEHVARHGLDVSIVRPRTILGHGRLGIFGILFDWIADGADVFVLGDGSNRYQFVHADDLADACVRAGASPGPAIFNVGTDHFGTMRETLEAVCAHAGTGSRVRALPAAAAAAAMRGASAVHAAPFAPYHWLMFGRSMWFDTEHVTEALGWRARWSNDEMFAQSYDWFLANRAGTSAAGRSQHRSATRQGALAGLKRATRLLPRPR
jgi:nucleoside-diphosphate-sugar epimerase